MERRQSNNNEEVGPVDVRGTTYWACVVLGISTLLPYNLFITAHEYFSYKFRSNNSYVGNVSNDNSLVSSFEAYFVLTSSIAGVVASIANVALAPHLSSKGRMISGHLLVILSLAVSIVFSFVDTDTWQTGFLWLNLVLLVLGQAGSTFMAGCTFGFAAQLPESRFTNGVISAQAFAGVFTSIISIVSIAVGSLLRASVVGTVYFSLAVAFTLFSLCVYMGLLKNRYAKYYMKRAAFISFSTDAEPLIVEPESDVVNSESGDSINGSAVGMIAPKESLPIFIRKTLYHGLALMLTLMATIVCFPALTSLVRSAAPSTSSWHTYFIAVACFLLFNTMDFVGRLLGNWKLWPKPESLLIGVFALLRFGFIFGFLFCNLPPYGAESKIFSNDFYYVCFVAMFGLTNGYLANLAAVYLPLSVGEADRDRAGAATNFYLAVGVLLGSVVSMFVVKFIAM